MGYLFFFLKGHKILVPQRHKDLMISGLFVSVHLLNGIRDVQKLWEADYLTYILKQEKCLCSNEDNVSHFLQITLRALCYRCVSRKGGICCLDAGQGGLKHLLFKNSCTHLGK